MSRRRALAACTGSVLLTVLLTASPALAANDDLAPLEGADLSAEISYSQAFLLFVVLPAVILFAIAALVWLPGMIKADRYRPQRGWSAAPVWFAGPPDPVAAVETAEAVQTGKGGASGSW